MTALRVQHGVRRLARRLSAASFVMAGLIAGQAHAQSADPIEIEVTAEVVERCGFELTAPVVVDVVQDLENANVQSVGLSLNCNTPFAVAAIATHGKLINETSPDDGSGFAFEKTYGVVLALDTDAGVVRSERCLSTDLVIGGACSFAGAEVSQGLESGEGIAIGRDATLTIDWPDQSTLTNRLAAGEYGDTITLVVGARA